MIRVGVQAEPAGFNALVRVPGKAFLQKTPNPTNAQFKTSAFWKKAGPDLYSAYRGVCAYSCIYLMPPGTIDHFLPKSLHPNDAYEWQNFRLCSYRINLYKGNSVDVIDPFVVQPGWFVLDFPSCLLKAGPNLSPVTVSQIENTIKTLKLNDDDVLVQERCDLMVNYANGDVTLNFLERRYPFLAVEIRRQGLVGTAMTVFKPKTT